MNKIFPLGLVIAALLLVSAAQAQTRTRNAPDDAPPAEQAAEQPEETAAEKKQKELPKSGTLASSRGGTGATSAAGVWGGTDAQGEDMPPIGGSVYRVRNQSWTMKLFNNSPDPYSFNVEVVQFGPRGETIKRDQYSYNLRAGETREQSFSASPSTVDAQLNLTRWKNLAPKKPARGKVQADGAAPPAATDRR